MTHGADAARDSIRVLDQGAASETLARRLQLERTADARGCETPFLLSVQDGRLQLAWTRPDAPGPVSVDLERGPAARRWREASRRGSLGRAIGPVRGSVIDANAGLGRDTAVLAALGWQVRAIERHAVLFALLEDGLRRAAASRDARLRELVARIEITSADARDVLATARPDVVYLDPMFPVRSKSALVKKDMQLFHELLGPQHDGAELLAAARAAARSRVVVKRPTHAEPLAARPDHTVSGTRVRFDVYLAR